MTGTWKRLPGHVLQEAGVEQFGVGCVRIPYRLRNGRVWGYRVVTASRAWWISADGTNGLGDAGILTPFGVDRQWPERLRRFRLLAICEGESDALALTGALGYGFDSIAAPGAGVWRPEWAAYTDGYAATYVFPDGDGAGRRFAERVLASVPGRMAVWLPAGEDVRSMVQGGRLPELVGLIEERDALEEFLTTKAPACASERKEDA